MIELRSSLVDRDSIRLYIINLTYDQISSISAEFSRFVLSTFSYEAQLVFQFRTRSNCFITNFISDFDNFELVRFSTLQAFLVRLAANHEAITPTGDQL